MWLMLDPTPDAAPAAVASRAPVVATEAHDAAALDPSAFTC